jgi:hypothetical protein
MVDESIGGGDKSSRMAIDNEELADQSQPVLPPRPFLKRKTKAIVIEKNP